MLSFQDWSSSTPIQDIKAIGLMINWRHFSIFYSSYKLWSRILSVCYCPTLRFLTRPFLPFSCFLAPGYTILLWIISQVSFLCNTHLIAFLRILVLSVVLIHLNYCSVLSSVPFNKFCIPSSQSVSLILLPLLVLLQVLLKYFTHIACLALVMLNCSS
jgi:hypothetical protein